jgi:hypothetical protein
VGYPNDYTLNMPNPVSAARGSPPISGTVVVQELRAPAYLRHGPIVYRPEPELIAFYDYHHWVKDPRRTVRAAIVRGLQQTLKSAELYDGRGDVDFLLTGSPRATSRFLAKRAIPEHSLQPVTLIERKLKWPKAKLSNNG